MVRLVSDLCRVPSGMHPIAWLCYGRALPGYQNFNPAKRTNFMLPKPGTYPARVDDKSVYENQNGVLIFAAHFVIDEQTAITGYFCLTRKDGGLNEKTLKNLREVFGWDGIDPFWLVDNELSEVETEIVVNEEDKDGGGVFTFVQYLNSPNSGGGGIHQSVDRNAVLAKYGNRFRAIAGGSPRTNPQPAPAKNVSPEAAPMLPPAKKTVPPSNVTPSTMQDAWQAFCQAAGENWQQDALTDAWHRAVKELIGKPQQECSGQDWGGFVAKMADWMDNQLPM